MHAQQHAKKYFKFFNASDQAELRPNPSDQAPGRSLVYTAADPTVRLSNFKISNFHNFLNSHQPKGCFLSDRQKSPKFYTIKNVKKKKPIAVFKKKKERQRQPAPPTPKRSKKSILIFANFFRFLCQAPRCGSKDSPFRSEY